MADIALIACTKSKRASRSSAAQLYTSPLFNKSLLYASTIARRIHILSAKHGLLNLDDKVDPYELSIKDLSSAEKKEWALRVGAKLRQIVTSKDTVHILAGQDYYLPLMETLKTIRCTVSFPLSDLSLGNRIRWLRKENKEAALERSYFEFHSALRELYIAQSGGRKLSECTGKLGWPSRGVYFIFEPNELLDTRRFKPLLQRITRVGTHAVSKGSKATLWDRLGAHKGTVGGLGNHRSSIFRLHVGAALMAQSPRKWSLPTWGAGQVAPTQKRARERKLEEEVSKVIGRMHVLWLNVPDEPGPQSDRAYLERNAIGLLSRANLVKGRQHLSWIGNFSPNISIGLSGLWNLNHLNEVPDVEFTKVFAHYVQATLEKIPLPSKPLAPRRRMF